MPFPRPPITEIVTRITGDVESSLQQTTPVLRWNVFRVMSSAVAGAVHGLYGYLSWFGQQVFPDTAEKEFLDRWASIWNISRKPATFATGPFIATGENGSDIEAGSILTGNNGLEYETEAVATISSGTATITVTCLTSGEAGNLAEGDTLTFSAPIAGVSAAGLVGEDGVKDGNDTETDDALRARVLDRIKNPPHGGSKSDYETWAKEVSGVTRAWCLPAIQGLGTVGVMIVNDDADPITPDEDKIEEVFDYIEERRPVTAELFVIAANLKVIDFEIEVTPDNSDVRDAIEAELVDFIKTNGNPGSLMYISQMNEVISGAAGETDHVMTEPSENIAVEEDEVAVLGTITWL